MIGSIRGKIIFKSEKFVIIETSGVGYKVQISPFALSELSLREKEEKGSDRSFLMWIHTHVREDILDLYGFLHREDLDFFEMLLGVSGIGPKGALSVLDVASVKTLKKAVSMGDIPYLTKISGIGRKTAEKIVLELKDKLTDAEGEKAGGLLREELDAMEALRSLGYSQHEAREAIKNISPNTDTNTKIRQALKILSGK